MYALRVHCWGGLGSQLYALSTARDLRSRFPKRRIILILHSAGVTSRSSELAFIPNLEFEVVTVNDFKERNENQSLKSHKRPISISFLIKKFLILFGFVATANSSSEFNKIKPWIISLRGHYFYRQVSPSFYSYLLSFINSSEEKNVDKKFNISIHYRMGDLLKLKEKSYVPVAKITDELFRVLSQHQNIDLNLYSDSPKEASDLLKNSGVETAINVHDLPAIEVIRACYKSNYFIGTNSKISLWIVNLRRYSGRFNENYLEGFDDKLYTPQDLSLY
jgi:hypothetical protein